MTTLVLLQLPWFSPEVLCCGKPLGAGKSKETSHRAADSETSALQPSKGSFYLGSKWLQLGLKSFQPFALLHLEELIVPRQV